MQSSYKIGFIDKAMCFQKILCYPLNTDGFQLIFERCDPEAKCLIFIPQCIQFIQGHLQTAFPMEKEYFLLDTRY